MKTSYFRLLHHLVSSEMRVKYTFSILRDTKPNKKAPSQTGNKDPLKNPSNSVSLQAKPALSKKTGHQTKRVNPGTIPNTKNNTPGTTKNGPPSKVKSAAKKPSKSLSNHQIKSHGSKRHNISAPSEIDWLTKEIMTEFKEAFSVFDKTGDGHISLNELGHVMDVMGLKKKKNELQEMMNEADMDEAGTIDFTEFLHLMAVTLQPVKMEDIKEAFVVFDKDQNELISAQEIGYVMKALGEKLSAKEAKDMVNQADLDGNGAVDYKEFIKLMLTQALEHIRITGSGSWE